MKLLVGLLSGLVLVAGAIPIAQARLNDQQAPAGGIAAGSAPDSCSEPPAGTTSQGPVAGMVFAWIPSGEFMMGSPLTEQDRESWEGPQHEVAVESFELMTTGRSWAPP
jgi:formylglycine-generating enzyme required for sulfatase activity